MPRHHTDDHEWILAGRDSRADDYYNELLDEGKGVIEARDLALKAFPDCRPYLMWLAT